MKKETVYVADLDKEIDIVGPKGLPTLLVGVNCLSQRPTGSRTSRLLEFDKMIQRIKNYGNQELLDVIHENTKENKDYDTVFNSGVGYDIIDQDLLGGTGNGAVKRALFDSLAIDFVGVSKHSHVKNRKQLEVEQKRFNDRYIKDGHNIHENVYSESPQSYIKYDDLDYDDYTFLDIDNEDRFKLKPMVLIEEHMCQEEYSIKDECYTDTETMERDMVIITSMEEVREYVEQTKSYKGIIVITPSIESIEETLRESYESAFSLIKEYYDGFDIANMLFESDDPDAIVKAALKHDMIAEDESMIEMLQDIGCSKIEEFNMETLDLVMQVLTYSLSEETFK